MVRIETTVLQLALAATLGALATGVFAAPAQAAPEEGLTCYIQGKAWPDPYVPSILGGGGVPGPLTPAMHRVSISASGQCWGQRNGTSVDGASAQLSSYYSDFYSYACDAGWWTDPEGDDTALTVSGIGSIGPIGYEMALADTNGALKIGGNATNPHTGSELESSNRGTGVIEVLGHDGCRWFDPVVNYDVIGAFTIRNGAAEEPAVEDVLPPGSGQPSAQCTSPTTKVFDGTAAGVYVRVHVQQNPTSTWVCVRVSSGGTSAGGRLVLAAPTVAGGAPTVDDNSGACQSTPGNGAPGPHPYVDAIVADQPVLFDAWSDDDELWACLEVGGSVTKRVQIAAPSVTGTPVRFERDA